jgi:hypothetical protein
MGLRSRFEPKCLELRSPDFKLYPFETASTIVRRSELLLGGKGHKNDGI